MLEKSPEAFKTISEAAEELGVEQHVLRFWETKFPQIKPLKRRGGRRYYRPEDMEALHRIQNLLHKQGFTIKGAKKAMNAKAPTVEATAALQEAAEATPAAQPRSAARKAPAAAEGQFDLLAAASPAETPGGLADDTRQTLENILAMLKAARKDLQSAA